MSKLKKFTLAMGIIAVICAILALVILPMTINSSIDLYNSIMREDVQLTSEVMLDENIKEIELNYLDSYYSNIDIRKSNDNKTHIVLANRGFDKFTANIEQIGDKAVVDLNRNGEYIIDKTSITTAIQYAVKESSYTVIIYIPSDINIITDIPYLRNPYTNIKYYIPNTTVEHQAPISLIEMNKLRNELRRNIADLEVKKIEFKSPNMEISTYASQTDYLYEQIMELRIKLLNAASINLHGKYTDPEMEFLVYKLTEKEQTLDFAKIRIDIIKYNYNNSEISREQYLDEIQAENEKVNLLTDEIIDLNQKFEEYCSKSADDAVTTSTTIIDDEFANSSEISPNIEPLMPEIESSAPAENTSSSMESELTIPSSSQQPPVSSSSSLASSEQSSISSSSQFSH